MLRGASSGAVIRVDRHALVGRQANADIQFDPQADLEVSARHALINFDGIDWHVRDLGSRNGTFVNGTRVSEARLEDGDRISFGWDGPEVEFHAVAGVTAASGDPTLTPTLGSPAHTGNDAMVRENRWLRWIATVAVATLAVAVTVGVWITWSQQTGWERERAELLARIDSALTAGDEAAAALTGEREGLALALEQSREEVRRVRRELESAGDGDTTEVPDLRRQLQSAMAALQRQQLAASLDYAYIERRARSAVAVVWVEDGNGVVTTGTAFAVRPDATLVTSRHVLTGFDNTRQPRRLAIQFSDSEQVWPARVLNISPTLDLAVVKADNILGDVPTVPGLNMRPDTLGAGLPVAWIGFPLGGETWPQDERTGRIARPIGAVGIITASSPDRVELQGYGAVGASGSPVLDPSGAVVALLYGSETRDGVQILHAVPATAIGSLLAQTATGR